MNRLILLSAVLALALVLTACSQDTEVGSKELLNVKEQQQKERLGEILRSPEPSGQASPGGAAALGAPSPTANQQEAEQKTLEVTLVSPPEYYAPGQIMQVPSGTKVIVTNKDTDTAENAQKPRRFKAGPYDTGDLKVGQSYEFVANVKGRFQLADPNVPFATGTFEVF